MFINDEKVQELSEKEAYEFLNNSEKLAKEMKYVFTEQPKMTIEELERLGCPINELTGLCIRHTVYRATHKNN